MFLFFFFPFWVLPKDTFWAEAIIVGALGVVYCAAYYAFVRVKWQLNQSR